MRRAPSPTTTSPQSRSRVVAALVRAAGTLGTRAMARMESELAWFGDLGAEERSWVAVIVHSGIRDFTEWYGAGERRNLPGPPRASNRPDHPGERSDPEGVEAAGPEFTDVAESVFGAAPRALAGVISLRRTVELVRLSISVVEIEVAQVVETADLPGVREAIARYAREVAFATAEVYARAAEVRGAWDARLEALVVDAVVRAEADASLLSRASALGFSAEAATVVALATMPGRATETDLFAGVRRACASAGMEALCATQGERLVVVVGGVSGADGPRRAGVAVAEVVTQGAVVVGPVAQSLAGAHASAREAMAAQRAVSGWPEAPRPVLADDLLAERALAGDGHARRRLVDDVHGALCARPTLLATLSAHGQSGGSVEGTARRLFVHPNTVRYRLRQIEETTGLSPTDPRESFTLQIALVLGRQSSRGR